MKTKWANQDYDVQDLIDGGKAHMAQNDIWQNDFTFSRRVLFRLPLSYIIWDPEMTSIHACSLDRA